MARRGVTTFVAGFTTALLIVGGTALADQFTSKEILVTYSPLKYFFNGEERFPPEDQKGFVYNNRTYVPLRFMSESLGKTVQFDPATYSIYVGRRPEALPQFWNNRQTEGIGALRINYYKEGALTLLGEEMPDSVLISAAISESNTASSPEETAAVDVTYEIPIGAKTISGTLFVPDRYFGYPNQGKVGKLMVMDAWNKVLYDSGPMLASQEPIPFSVKIDGMSKMRLVVLLYPNLGVPSDGALLTAEIGVAGLKVQ